MSAMMEQYGDEETAANVCGAFEQGYLPGSKSTTNTNNNNNSNNERSQFITHVEPISVAAIPTQKDTVRILGRSKSGNHLYLKVFLIDASINQNNWGVSTATIDDNIKTAIGKPLVLYKNTGLERDSPYRRPGLFDHPPMDDSNLEHTYEMQDIFRIGTIIDLVKDVKGAWWGIVEVANPGVKKALYENPEIPFFLSPAIMTRDQPQQSQNLSSWVFVHIAMVSQPAFGATKAFVKGECSGDKEACLLRLRKASIEKAGGEEKGCGFCTYQALMQMDKEGKEPGSPAHALRTKRVEVKVPVAFDGTIANPTKYWVGEPGKPEHVHVKPLINNASNISSHVEKSSNSSSDTNLSSATLQQQNEAPQHANQGLQQTVEQVTTERTRATAPLDSESVEEINEINSPDNNNATTSGNQNSGERNIPIQKREINTTKSTTTTTKPAKSASAPVAPNGNLVTIERSKLASLIAEKNRYKQQVASVQQELSDSQTRIASLEALDKVHTQKLASLDSWSKQLKRRERFTQIANFIASAPVFKGLTPEEKDEQARNLAASSRTIQQIMKDFEPLNKAAISAQEQGGSASANVDEFGNITAGTSVPKASTEFDNEQVAVMPFGGSGNYQSGKLVKASVAAPHNSEEEKIPFGIRAALELLGDKGVEL